MKVQDPKVRTGAWMTMLSLAFRICVLKFSAICRLQNHQYQHKKFVKVEKLSRDCKVVAFLHHCHTVIAVQAAVRNVTPTYSTLSLYRLSSKISPLRLIK